ncbi:hypothetical protein Cpin_0208 [Chitinophaga pinensis DSM 2588]|uniref:Uncharacterized protein n=1 Tax=Chitinophaga pinensis (strain ATCC 43595 / DSM 2588 / LMG 13176 / NBRC 15968 / NCIMB 11800 / UQM 2034) TaxID=485918 RepID=A0A979GPW5_CHIPD|nr:hypothetical protein Cpin_0208 [Chitinophaga pinensis DSM 2588]
MPINPVVHTLIWIACIASLLYPIIPLIKHITASMKSHRKFVAEMEKEINKFKTDPKKYKAKQY